MNKSIRENFPALGVYKAYLNTASLGLIPRSTVSMLNSVLSELSLEPDLEDYLDGVKENARREIGRLINAKPLEIGFGIQTTECLKKAITMLEPGEGTGVISLDLEFPTVTSIIESMCRAKKCKPIVVSSRSLEDLESAFNRAARESNLKRLIIVVSSVNWVRGFRLKLRELSKIAHENSGLLIVDGVQQVGALKLDAKKEDVDILCSGGEKWLLTPCIGAGFMYIREELISELELPPYGILNRSEPENKWSYYWADPNKDPWALPPVSRDAAKYEWGGGPAYFPIAALGESVKLINSIGIEAVEEHLMRLRKAILDKAIENGYTFLSPTSDPERYSSIVLVSTGRGISVDMKVAKTLRSTKYMISYRGANGFGGIRISPHFYNTLEDIEIFFEEFSRQVRSASSGI
ncbi:MAG: aminotransferase class V-fold PLP-dependent enzyme [Desulfurococcaceae archaeon]